MRIIPSLVRAPREATLPELGHASQPLQLCTVWHSKGTDPAARLRPHRFQLTTGLLGMHLRAGASASALPAPLVPCICLSDGTSQPCQFTLCLSTLRLL